MVDFVRPRFHSGQVVATPGALEVIAQGGHSPAEFLDRHVRGDWGRLSAGDRQLNEEALKDGSRILSAYGTRNGKKIWIITEAADDRGHRAATTILLPDEY
jgi:hypothetical protein